MSGGLTNNDGEIAHMKIQRAEAYGAAGAAVLFAAMFLPRRTPVWYLLAATLLVAVLAGMAVYFNARERMKTGNHFERVFAAVAVIFVLVCTAQALFCPIGPSLDRPPPWWHVPHLAFCGFFVGYPVLCVTGLALRLPTEAKDIVVLAATFLWAGLCYAAVRLALTCLRKLLVKGSVRRIDTGSQSG